MTHQVFSMRMHVHGNVGKRVGSMHILLFERRPIDDGHLVLMVGTGNTSGCRRGEGSLY